MKRLLIINPAQFGYHSDTYYYCKYLGGVYAVTYICWDYGNEKIQPDNTRVVYVSRKGGKLQRLWRLMMGARTEMKRESYAVAFIVYFRFCSLLRFSDRGTPMNLDVRTGYVRPGKLKRRIYNIGVWVESMFFQHVSVISEGLRKDLMLGSNAHVLPLGADTLDASPKNFEHLRLIYVGTFVNRRMHDTVLGLELFMKTAADANISYDIIGFGGESDQRRLQEAIYNSSVKSQIAFHGRIAHKDLPGYFRRSNVGVAYVPMEDHFQSQPPTKVFEYLLSGMPVIATGTRENERVIAEANGVLHDDTPEGFCNAIKKVYERRSRYSSDEIRKDASKYSWETIIHKNLEPYLLRIGRSHRGSGVASAIAHGSSGV